MRPPNPCRTFITGLCVLLLLVSNSEYSIIILESLTNCACLREAGGYYASVPKNPTLSTKKQDEGNIKLTRLVICISQPFLKPVNILSFNPLAQLAYQADSAPAKAASIPLWWEWSDRSAAQSGCLSWVLSRDILAEEMPGLGWVCKAQTRVSIICSSNSFFPRILNPYNTLPHFMKPHRPYLLETDFSWPRMLVTFPVIDNIYTVYTGYCPTIWLQAGLWLEWITQRSQKKCSRSIASITLKWSVS